MEKNKPYIQKPVIHVDIIVHMKNQSLLWFQTQPFNEEELKGLKKKQPRQKNIVYVCHCHRNHDPLTKTGNKRIKIVQ